MTESAKKYFELYYKIQRVIDENDGELKKNKLRKEMELCYNQMTEKEQQMVEIVGIEHAKYTS